MTTPTREGRYTGPSFQEGQAPFEHRHGKEHRKLVTPFVARPARPGLQQTRAQAERNKNAGAIADLHNAGGIMACGLWQTGAGNYKKQRDTPTGAKVYQKYESTLPAKVREWFMQHPRAVRCIALKSWVGV